MVRPKPDDELLVDFGGRDIIPAEEEETSRRTVSKDGANCKLPTICIASYQQGSHLADHMFSDHVDENETTQARTRIVGEIAVSITF